MQKIKIEEFINSIENEKIALLTSMFLDQFAQKLNKKIEDYEYLNDLVKDFKEIEGWDLLIWEIESRVFADFEYKYGHLYGEITRRDEKEYDKATALFYDLLFKDDRIRCAFCDRPQTVPSEGRFIDGSWASDAFFVFTSYQFAWVCSHACYIKLMEKAREEKLKGEI